MSEDLKNEIEISKNIELENEIYQAAMLPKYKREIAADLIAEKHKLKKTNVKSMLKEAKRVEATRQKTAAELKNSEKINDFLASGITMPLKYKIRESQIFEEVETIDDIIEKKVCDFIAVIARTENQITGELGYKLVFKYGHELKTVTVDALTLADRNKILKLAQFGFPVHSGNAVEVTKFITEFVSVNLHLIPTIVLAKRPGFHLIDNTWVYILGRKVFPPEMSTAIEKLAEGQATETDDHFRTSGDRDVWIKQIIFICNHPNMLFIFGAAISGMFLDLVGCSNFIVHWRGRSTTGKSIAIEVAASFYGDPNLDKIVKTWQSTGVGLEAKMNNANGNAIFLDDLSNISSNLNVEQVIYLLASGVGKVRGRKDGSVSDVHKGQFVVLSNGEEPLASINSKDGAVARVLEVSGNIFIPDESISDLLKILRSDIRLNFGFGAEMIIPKLLEIKNSEEKLKQLRLNYKNIINRIVSQSESHLVNRVAGYYATIEIALKTFFGEVLTGLVDDKDIESIVDAQFLSQKARYSTENAIDLRALRYIFDRIQSEAFRVRMGENLHGASWGRTVERKDHSSSGIAILPSILREILRDGEFEPESIIGFLTERGVFWENNGSNLYPIKYLGVQQRMYVFDLPKLEKLGIILSETEAGEADGGDDEEIGFK